MHHVHLEILVDERSVVPRIAVRAVPASESAAAWPSSANVTEITMLEAVLTRVRRFAQELQTEEGVYEGEST